MVHVEDKTKEGKAVGEGVGERVEDVGQGGWAGRKRREETGLGNCKEGKQRGRDGRLGFFYTSIKLYLLSIHLK